MDKLPTPASVLLRLRGVSASSPRLVWYGPDGRIELSGRVFDNWVAKTSNFLVDELDASRGTRVELDLPVHWKSLAWAMACWQVGAVITPGVHPTQGLVPAEPADVVVTSAERGPVAPPAVLVQVALGSLALRWPSALPQGAVDYAAEVRSHGDVFTDAAAQDARTVLFESTGPADLPAGAGAAGQPAGGGLTLEGLLSLYSGTPEPSGVVLLEAGASLRHALAAALSVWGVDGTLVLVHPEVPVTQALLDGERVGARAAFAPEAG
jgi:uncharacterized protein (TIGR03089 family)